MPSLIAAITTVATLCVAAFSPVSGEDAGSQLTTISAGAGDALQLLPELELLEGLPVATTEGSTGRALLMRKRGRSKSSPKGKKKKGKKKGKKKKGGKKRKGGKKKKGKKKGGKRKKGGKKKSSVFRSQGGGGGGSYSKTSRQFSGHGTHFAAMGKPYGGCGVPPGKAYDDNGKALPWVALNTNAEFENGVNCGRWLEITLGQNCVGAGNSQWSICNGGSAPSSLSPDCSRALARSCETLMSEAASCHLHAVELRVQHMGCQNSYPPLG